MKLLMVALMSTLLSAAAASAEAPPLDYVAVPDDFKLPAGMTFGSTSGVAVNSKGNIGRTGCGSTATTTSGPPTSLRTWSTR